MPVITTAGENLISAQQAAGQNLVVDQIIFANIPGLDHTATVSKAEGKPIAGNIVATESITQAGLVNESTVVYSITMPSTMGTYSFNWMGLYSSVHDTVIAIAYTPVQEKRATVGEVLGNVLNKNFAIEFISASETTGITINAESWQIDYTARLETMDEIQRQALKVVYGQATFLNDAFKCEFNGTNYVLKAGECILGGLINIVESDLLISPSALPKTIWVDAYQIKTMAGVQNTFDVILNDGTELTNNLINGVYHSLIKIAVVNSQASIFDERINITSDLSHWTKGNTPDATTTQKGFAKLIDSVTSPSILLAATAKAVKAAYDKGVEALNLANTKAASSHSHAEGDLPNASTTAQGMVQLSSITNGTSTTKAATESVIKILKDLVTTAQNTANGKAAASHTHTAAAVGASYMTLYVYNTGYGNAKVFRDPKSRLQIWSLLSTTMTLNTARTINLGYAFADTGFSTTAGSLHSTSGGQENTAVYARTTTTISCMAGGSGGMSIICIGTY
jgi:hypothetical protein